MKLELKDSSWENIFETIRNSTHIESRGNFWAAVQHLEQQFEEQKTVEKI